MSTVVEEQATTPLTLELIDASNGSVVHTYQDDTLLPLLRRSYGVDIESALPHEALSQNFSVAAILALCTTAQEAVEQGNMSTGTPLLQKVQKFEDEMTPTDVMNMRVSPYHLNSAKDDRTMVEYMEPRPVVGNPYIQGILADIAALRAFFTEAESGSYLLRNSAFVQHDDAGVITEPVA